jgi:hypothetical protein
VPRTFHKSIPIIASIALLGLSVYAFLHVEIVPVGYRVQIYERAFTGKIPGLKIPLSRFIGAPVALPVGPVLDHGIYVLPFSQEIRMVDCNSRSGESHIQTRTNDGAQEEFLLSVSYDVNCGDDLAVSGVLHDFSLPSRGEHLDRASQIYDRYVDGPLRRAVYLTAAAYSETDLIQKRAKVINDIESHFEAFLAETPQSPVRIRSIALHDIQFTLHD